jgi:hypothetical protein
MRDKLRRKQLIRRVQLALTEDLRKDTLNNLLALLSCHEFAPFMTPPCILWSNRLWRRKVVSTIAPP